MIKFFTAFLAISAISAGAFAQEATNTSNVKTSDVQPTVETQKDIDKEITNARMRATLGSKSKWSIKTALGYSGGSVERPFDRIRPNYQAGTTTPVLTNLSGSVGIKYSLSGSESLSLGTGIVVRNPLHGDLNRGSFSDPRNNKSTERFNVANPSLSYSNAYKVSGIQMVTDAGYTHSTESDSVKNYNSIGGASISQTGIMALGNSGWEGGISISAGYSFYNGDMDAEFAAANPNAAQDDFSYGIYPFAEYAFNDRFSFRTVFGYFGNTHYKSKSGDQAAVVADTPYQSMGIGMSISRDIYLYPNIQFTPLDIRADRTNVALSANINVF
jgi:hypothetical protein